ncbi:MAG: hypothetical protein MJZ82_01110 [Paludibacteraceae bacterium]|nr:hypothetical protein [Paludibacteraceae bacterium]
MKKIAFFMALALVLGMSSCGKKAAENVKTTEEVIAQAAELVDSEVTVEGICVGVCKHTGRKAFLQDTADGNVLFIAAADEMEPFAQEAVGQTIRVKGVMKAIINEPAEAEEVTEEMPAEDTTAAVEEVNPAVANEEMIVEKEECQIENPCCEKEQKAMSANIIYYVEATSYEIL